MKKVTILKMLVVLIITIMISGCAIKEVYFLNRPIYPSDLNSDQKQKMQATEIERQKIEAEESLRRQERGECSYKRNRILTLRF